MWKIFIFMLVVTLTGCTKYDSALKYLGDNGYAVRNTSPKPLLRQRGEGEVFFFSAEKDGVIIKGMITERRKLDGSLDWWIVQIY